MEQTAEQVLNELELSKEKKSWDKKALKESFNFFLSSRLAILIVAYSSIFVVLKDKFWGGMGHYLQF